MQKAARPVFDQCHMGRAEMDWKQVRALFSAGLSANMASLLHIHLLLIILGRAREELKVRMRGRNCSNQRHPNLP